jgi:hypothetical protein
VTGLDSDEAALTDEQQLVLQAIYDRFREHGEWPMFISIDRPLRREHRMNTRAVFSSLPDALVVKTRLAMGPSDTDELILRLPGIAVCTGGDEDTERFVRMLRWFAEQEVAFAPPADSEDTMPRVTSDNVAAFLELRRNDPAQEAALQRLYAMLRLDHWGLGANGSDAAGWFVDLATEIWRFREVNTVKDVIRVREQWIAEAQAAAPYFRSPAPITRPGNVIQPVDVPESAEARLPDRVMYVDQQVIDAIAATVGSSTFDIGKLLALIDEQNVNYAAEHTYAAHALLRAILDHIPPILGQRDFTAVVNNYSWSRTDQGYLTRLLNCKTQADDALHRQISARP